MITKEQAILHQTFHKPAYNDPITPVPTKCYVWRRNGSTKTWITRPSEYRVPVKYGLRTYNYITEQDADQFYIPIDCPFCHGSRS